MVGNLSTKIVGVITAILIFISLYLIFGYARTESTMLEVQKIFYYHVSAALTLYLAFGVNCLFSIKYLIQRKSDDDLLAAAAAEIGLIFCTIVLLSGPIWAKYAWNTWWNWEPRLTSTLVLWLMYIGYFILRSALEADKRKLYSAVLGVIAFVDVPIVHFATKFWKSEAHPERGAKFDIAPSMLHTFLVALVACILLFTLLLIARYRMKKTEARYEIIQQRHLGEAS
ncbi:cytochrome C assembly protein [Candidatus Poribacteria bacterium]|nr:MAG: cytochrome C assembly protein [Candidatus Poribacteria bacterium]